MGNAVFTEYCPGCCPRVLVVENDITVRSDHIEHLRRWGYEPFAAEGTGAQLLDDAAQKAAKHRCHIALVDMRLLDDYNRQDTSGLALVPQLKPTIAIIVSGYGDRAAVREALKAKQAFDFVGKEEGPSRLRQAVREALRQRCNCLMQIQWRPGYEPPDIVRKLLPEFVNAPIDEPSCIISRLYADEEVTQIDLNHITDYYGAIIDLPARERSVVMIARAQGADQHWRQAEIVKLTQRKPIEDEVSNYHRYVSPHLSPQRTARLEDRAHAVTLWDLGGLRYTNVATEQRKPFRQWYAQATTEQVIETITDLFEETLQPWYQLVSPQQVNTVYDYYVNTFPKLERRLAANADQPGELNIPGLDIPLTNPVSWSCTHSRKSRFLSHWEAYTHGDLHGGNIFVDQFRRTAVIDYERSGPGYFLRDIVELEIDIRLRMLIVTRNELPLTYEFDTILLTPEHPDHAPQWRTIPTANPETLANLRKAFDVIVELRRLAKHITRFERMDEYYWALLMESLFSVLRDYAKWSDQTEANLARDRALLSASLICDRLEQWGKEWPVSPHSADDKRRQPQAPPGEKSNSFPH
ncbi:MAG: phosphotransferase [Chloroflexales bacterium]|nr:phosphotransferase [Chloroflexales bacterium]